MENLNRGFKLVATPSGNSFAGVQILVKRSMGKIVKNSGFCRRTLNPCKTVINKSSDEFKPTIRVKIFHR